MAADSEEIIRILKETIAFHVKNSEEQQNTIASLREQVRELQQTVANLNETLAELERKMFGSASERSRRKKKQKDDADGAEPDPETKTVTVAEHTRTVKKEKTSREDLYADLPVENIYCDAAGEERICPECLDRTEMEHLGYEFVREELTIQEAVVKRTRYYREKMICPVCKKEGETTIVKGPVPAPLSKHGVSSPSMVAHVMYNKSVLCLPFYRQESDWKRKGVPLPRGTMARWYNECGTKYLLPIYERLHEELLKREIIHADEVPCQVLHEEGRRAQSKSYMWIFLSGNDGKPAVVLYDYQPGRKGEYVRSFLDGFKGLVHCDGYQAYGTLEDVVLLICLAHCRRKFFEAVPKGRRDSIRLLDTASDQDIADPSGQLIKDDFSCPGEKGVAFCNRLFYLERLYREMTPQARSEKRLEEETPVWEDFWDWIETLNPAGGSKLETAVNYAKNHRTELMNYLMDGRCEISNNRAEREAKAYVISRKNSLFHDTVKGAAATAVVMSIIETAKANQLNVYQYLYYLLLYMPDYKEESAGIEQLLPWSTFIREHCSGKIDTETVRPHNKGKLPFE